MTTPSKKPGRKPKHYRTSDNRIIEGLTRAPNGRWRIIGTSKTFREENELRAIAKFRAMQRGELLPARYLQFPAAIAEGDPFNFDAPITGEHAPKELTESDLYLWFAEQIRQSPKHVAAMTGIEEIGYLERIKAPAALPSLKSLEDNWWEHAEVTSGERRAVRAAWQEFISAAKITGLAGVTTDSGDAFKAHLIKRGLSAKSMRSKMNRVRRILSFAIEKRIARDEIRRALAELKEVKFKKTRRILKPQPISSENFATLLAKANQADAAMLLISLNAGLYLQEMVRVRWDEIDAGCYIGQRNKTGECLRVATLWKETQNALAVLPRKSEYIFLSETGKPLTISGASKRFRKLRKDAEVPESVKASHLRDGAATAMRKAGVDDSLRKLLLGHSCGMEDHYVLRDPSIVAPACDAVHAKYFK